MNHPAPIAPSACPICDQAKFASPWLVDSNSDGALNEEYWVYACRTCGAGVTFPVPTAEVLGRYYDSGVYRASGGRGFYLLDAILNVACAHRLREIARLSAPPGRLLDLGSGKGRFLACAVRHGWTAQGVETSAHQVAAARARYGIRVFGGDLRDAAFADASFDVVTAWHVLEHLPDPDAYVQEIHRVLRPGGVFACEVPNIASCQAQLGRSTWYHLDIPRHLVHYAPNALASLVTRHGLHPVRLHTLSLESGPFGMLQSMLNRVGLPVNGLYRWLKRCNGNWSKRMAAVNILLEIATSLVGKGGVIRVIARRDGAFLERSSEFGSSLER